MNDQDLCIGKTCLLHTSGERFEEKGWALDHNPGSLFSRREYLDDGCKFWQQNSFITIQHYSHNRSV
jgi:hypothetical protein